MSGSGQSLMKDLKAIPSKGSQRIHKTASILLNVQQNERMGGCKTWILRSTTLCVYPMSTCEKLSRAFSPPCLDTANIGWRWWRPRNEVICMYNLDCKSSDSGRVWSGSFLHPKKYLTHTTEIWYVVMWPDLQYPALSGLGSLLHLLRMYFYHQ